MNNNGLSSFLLGLGVGVGLGLLFAPKSGEETRGVIRDKAGEGADFVKQRAGEGAEFIKQRGTQMQQTAAEWVDKGKDALGRQKTNLSDAMEAGKQAYRDTVNRQAPLTEGEGS